MVTYNTANDIQLYCSFISSPDDAPPQCSDLPSDLTRDTDLGQSTANISWTPPTLTDNSGSVIVIAYHEPGDTFPIGVTSVIYQAIDSSGLETVCSFRITVEGNSV